MGLCTVTAPPVITLPIVDVGFGNVKGVRTHLGEEITSDEGVLDGPATTWLSGEIPA